MMEPLHKFFLKENEIGMFSAMGLRSSKTRARFYADDATLFLNPMKEDMIVTHSILTLTGQFRG
jgi:hypothetical protein